MWLIAVIGLVFLVPLLMGVFSLQSSMGTFEGVIALLVGLFGGLLFSLCLRKRVAQDAS